MAEMEFTYDDPSYEWQIPTTLLGTLDQDEVWGRPGERIKIEDLTPDHLDNIINYLRSRAMPLKFAYDYQSLSIPLPQGEADYDAVVNDRGFEQPALEWLEETPLMRKLVELQEPKEGWL